LDLKAKYISVWKLCGASHINDEDDGFEIGRDRNSTAVAKLVADPEPHFFHIDRAGALAAPLLNRTSEPANA
jgi:hypothetical protein